MQVTDDDGNDRDQDDDGGDVNDDFNHLQLASSREDMLCKSEIMIRVMMISLITCS